MKIGIILIILVMQFTLNAQVIWHISKTSAQKFYLSQHDEFNDGTLNEKLWNAASSTYDKNNEVYYLPQNVVFNNGSISLFTKTDEAGGNTKYTASALTSQTLFNSGYFEMRFKISETQNILSALILKDDKGEAITVFETKEARDKKSYFDFKQQNNSKKIVEGCVTFSEKIGSDWNIVSALWKKDTLKYFFNGEVIGCYAGKINTSKHLEIFTSVPQKMRNKKNNAIDQINLSGKLEIDYVRYFSAEDTSGLVKDNYSLFEKSPQTIENRLLYSAEIKKKKKSLVKYCNSDLGTITILPVYFNKYSVSVQGKNLTNIQIDVVDRFNAKVAGFALNNIQYYTMDLSALPTGPYKIKMNVAGQILEQEIPVINPDKIGEQNGAK